MNVLLYLIRKLVGFHVLLALLLVLTLTSVVLFDWTTPRGRKRIALDLMYRMDLIVNYVLDWNP